MNNTLDRVFEDLIRLLNDEVIPRLEGDTVRSQAYGAIFMLKNLQLRVDWSAEPLLEDIRAQDTLFRQARETGAAVAAALPAAARVAADTPSGAQLLVLRDAGNALVSQLIRQVASSPDPADHDQGRAVDALVQAYMRAELDMEMRHIPKPMFAEMSSGRSQSPATSGDPATRTGAR